MTYNLGIKVSNGLSYAMVVSDSRATFDDKLGGVAGENFAKNFLIPKKPGKRGTQDFILAGSGNLGLLYGARQAVIDKGPFYDISSINDILLNSINEARKNYSDRQIPSFIVAGPNKERRLSLVHIDDAVHDESGYKDCVVSAQSGSGFEYVRTAARERLADGGKFDIDDIYSAASLGVQLLRQIARHDPGVNGKPQLLVIRYDGKETKAGMMYPTGIKLNTGNPDEEYKFMRQNLGVMSGLNDLTDTANKKRVHEFLANGGMAPYGTKTLTKEHFEDLFLRTGQDMSEFYDRFMATIKFLSENKNSAYLADAENLMRIALVGMVEKNHKPFFDAHRQSRIFSKRTTPIELIGP